MRLFLRRSSPSELSAHQAALSIVGRRALASLPGTCRADAWRIIDAGLPGHPHHLQPLPKVGAGQFALSRYGELLAASRKIPHREVGRTLERLLRHPRRLTRAVETYAAQTSSPCAGRLVQRTAPSFSELVLTLKTLRDRPDLLSP